MKKLFFTLAILAGFAMQALAYDFQSGDLLYTIISTDPPCVSLDGHVDGENAQGELDIPSTVTCGDVTYTVAEIGEWAFKNCSGLTSFEIPSTIDTIQEGAFYGCSGFTGTLDLSFTTAVLKKNVFRECSGFTELILPLFISEIPEGAFCGCSGLTGTLVLSESESLEIIGEGAFARCSGFTGLVLPNGLREIREQAFAGCTGFTGNLVIPETVTHIKYEAFGHCTGFSGDLIIPNSVVELGNTQNSNYYVNPEPYSTFADCFDHLVLSQSLDTIGPRCFAGCTRLTGDLVLPTGLKAVFAYAFQGCTGLTGLMINDALTSIGSYAFSGCSGIRGTVTIPENISIGMAAFEWCSGIEELVLPHHIVFQSNPDKGYVFQGCRSLAELEIPEGWTTIEKSTFSQCSNLRSVRFPASLTSIGFSAFSECSSLEEVYIPEGVTEIGNGAFSRCSSLTHIELPVSLRVLAGQTFARCTSLTGEVVIPDLVQRVELMTFDSCYLLNRIVFGDSINYIAEPAFEHTQLDSLVFKSMTPPELQRKTTEGAWHFPDNLSIVVPCGTLEAYQNSEDWADFTNITEDCGSGDDMLEAYCEAPFNFGGSPTTDQGIYGAQLWWNKPFASHWFHYDDKPYAGSAEAFEWGIRIPGEEIHAGDMLTHVAFYKVGCQNEVEQYDFAFSGGETEPENLEFLAWNSVLVEPGPDEWVMVKLRYPIICEEGRSLWIVMRAPFIAGNKAPYCQTSGNPDARWVSLIGGWYDYLAVEGTGGDWMIRGYFTNDMGYQEAGYNEELDHYNIYRGSSLEEMEKVAEVGRDEEEYFDTLQQPFGDYYYQLTASYTDGRESVPAKRSENPQSPDYVYFHVGNISSLGSEWYYEIQDENGSITYQHLQYAADTTVNHKDVKIIIRTNTLYDKGEHSEVTREYIYEDFGKVYWWNETLQDFTLLYDLGAQTGDEWEIKVGTESIIMHVDTVEQYEYEGTTYRMLHVSDANNLFSGEIMSGIGHLTSFFPERLMSKGKAYRVEGIRCYWREGELVFKYGEKDCDEVYQEIHNGIEEDGPSIGSGTLTVYPNPTDGVLFVQIVCTPSLPYQTYRITNLMGQMVIMGTLDAEKRQIDVSNLPKGMYFISVGDMTRKFVVNE